MFDIFITTHFSAGHHLRDYPGNCEKPHGHNWNIKVTVRARELDHLGMGVDFRVIKKAVAQVMDDLDHCDLNSHQAFREQNPSSENISVYIFEQLAGELSNDRYDLYSIQVGETANSGVIYRGGR